jgi:hypothetical protein
MAKPWPTVNNLGERYAEPAAIQSVTARLVFGR